MEPLSITAAIGGLLGVSSRLYEYLHAYFTTAKDAPDVLITISTEIRDTQLALASLQVLLTTVAFLSNQRTALIQFEDLADTVADTVLTYSELEATITPFIAKKEQGVTLKARLGWTQAEDECFKIIDRLQLALAVKVDQILQINQFLFQRFMKSETRLEVESLLSGRLKDTVSNLEDDNQIIRTNRPSDYHPTSVEEAIRFTFHEDLKMSRIYHMTQKEGCGHSIISSAVQTTSWSIFSGLTLDSLTFSVISVFSLPLYPSDITNSNDCAFGQQGKSQLLNLQNSLPAIQVLFEPSESQSLSHQTVSHQKEAPVQQTNTRALCQ
ncbi:hypothetical protein BU25DRAFT_416042 [Macroventuria anomochaeta]|uniref:Uncharacterized protein n=1 Tax=Macroventuria anomochaeta TaxID=301207 RepID=A0ACB6RHZ2_9PLEO|nr:uncharacterized protein BU25DRAFT_416042 [Macroventuria anomochaeta]KAF2621511.1 hypothetical protein BU25DRAFT_416042 [Macroventuria anomochaeta]